MPLLESVGKGAASPSLTSFWIFVTFVSVSERSHITEGIQIILGLCLSVLFL